MTIRWTLALAVLALIAADPALARVKHKAHHKPHVACNDRPHQFSWSGLWFNGPPQWNGCSPPVHESGKYIGQDPDPNVRHGIMRDPSTGSLPDVGRQP